MTATVTPSSRVAAQEAARSLRWRFLKTTDDTAPTSDDMIRAAAWALSHMGANCTEAFERALLDDLGLEWGYTPMGAQVLQRKGSVAR